MKESYSTQPLKILPDQILGIKERTTSLNGESTGHMRVRLVALLGMGNFSIFSPVYLTYTCQSSTQSLQWKLNSWTFKTAGVKRSDKHFWVVETQREAGEEFQLELLVGLIFTRYALE